MRKRSSPTGRSAGSAGLSANFLAHDEQGMHNDKIGYRQIDMIQLSKNYSLREREEEIIPIKIVGVGGAGANALDRIVLDGMEKADLIAINTDVQSLASSVSARKVQLGRSVTRGLGAGGDPDVRCQAAQETDDDIRRAWTDARRHYICMVLYDDY